MEMNNRNCVQSKKKNCIAYISSICAPRKSDYFLITSSLRKSHVPLRVPSKGIAELSLFVLKALETRKYICMLLLLLLNCFSRVRLCATP